MWVAPSPSCDNQQYLHTLPSVPGVRAGLGSGGGDGGAKLSWLRTTTLHWWSKCVSCATNLKQPWISRLCSKLESEAWAAPPGSCTVYGVSHLYATLSVINSRKLHLINTCNCKYCHSYGSLISKSHGDFGWEWSKMSHSKKEEKSDPSSFREASLPAACNPQIRGGVEGGMAVPSTCPSARVHPPRHCLGRTAHVPKGLISALHAPCNDKNDLTVFYFCYMIHFHEFNAFGAGLAHKKVGNGTGRKHILMAKIPL